MKFECHVNVQQQPVVLIDHSNGEHIDIAVNSDIQEGGGNYAQMDITVTITAHVYNY